MQAAHKDFLVSVLGVQIVAKPGIYQSANLGFSGRAKQEIFNCILEKVRGKLQGSKCGILNLAGRCVLINHVLHSIPVYLMSVLKMPLSFLSRFTAIIRNLL